MKDANHVSHVNEIGDKNNFMILPVGSTFSKAHHMFKCGLSAATILLLSIKQ